jgi:hypothetical protein
MDTPDPTTTLTPFDVTVSRPERLFPTLTPAQLARIAAHGRLRMTTRGEVLVDVGDRIAILRLAGYVEMADLLQGVAAPAPIPFSIMRPYLEGLVRAAHSMLMLVEDSEKRAPINGTPSTPAKP